MSGTPARHHLFHAIVVVGAGLVAGAACGSDSPHPDATITLLDARRDGGVIVDAPPSDAVDAMVVIL